MRKGVISQKNSQEKNFSKIHRKTPVPESGRCFPVNFGRFFPVNFARFLRTSFLQKTYGRLPLAPPLLYSVDFLISGTRFCTLGH